MSFEIEWEIVLFLVAFLSGCLATLERVEGKTCYCYCGCGESGRENTCFGEKLWLSPACFSRITACTLAVSRMRN